MVVTQMTQRSHNQVMLSEEFYRRRGGGGGEMLCGCDSDDAEVFGTGEGSFVVMVLSGDVGWLDGAMGALTNVPP